MTKIISSLLSIVQLASVLAILDHGLGAVSAASSSVRGAAPTPNDAIAVLDPFCAENCKKFLSHNNFNANSNEEALSECLEKFCGANFQSKYLDGADGNSDDNSIDDEVEPTDEEQCQANCRRKRWAPRMIEQCISDCQEQQQNEERSIDSASNDAAGAAADSADASQNNYQDADSDNNSDDGDDDEVIQCELRCRMKRWAPRMVDECVQNCHNATKTEPSNYHFNSDAIDNSSERTVDSYTSKDEDFVGRQNRNKNKQQWKADRQQRAHKFARGNDDADNNYNGDDDEVLSCQRQCRRLRTVQRVIDQCMQNCRFLEDGNAVDYALTE